MKNKILFNSVISLFRLRAAIVVLAVHFPVFAELVFRVEERVSKIFPTERGWAPGMLP